MDDLPHLTYQSIVPQSLDIRLFELLPYGDGDFVRGELRKSSPGGGYIALSYCWGAPTDTRSIIIDGCKLSIPRNLEAALREMHRKRSTAGRFSNMRLPIW